MNLKRVWTLIRAEILHGPKDVVLAMAVVMPILMALLVNLAFGNIFTQRAELGIYDRGESAIVEILAKSESVSLRYYENETDLKQASASGAVDMGIVLPQDFDASLPFGKIKFEAYVWGESLAKNREVIPIVLTDAVRTLAGSELPVNIEAVALGDEESVPWSSRLVPLVILMGIFYGGLMIPSSAIIHEKQRRTIEALNVTPTTVGDIFLSKGIISVTLATFMGIVTLILSGALSGPIPLIILVLFLGAIMATEIGLIVGAFVNDINSLFAVLKAGGIFLFGPALIYMFPQIPSWVGYIFPTYYVVRPIVDLSISGVSFSEVLVYLSVLVILVILGAVLLVAVVRRLSTRALRLGS